ncbi:MAG: hypothetical protein ACYCXN_09235, partial [Acidimicrobiales bacterium]
MGLATILLASFSTPTMVTASASSTLAGATTATTTATSGSSSPGELYVAGAYGLMVSYNAGSTPGYVYSTDNNIYGTNVTSATDATASTGGWRWWTVAALFKADLGGCEAPSISAVGSPVTAPLGLSTTYNLPVSPTAGNLVVVYSTAVESSLSSISGGGVTNWHSAISQFQPTAAGASIWWGQVATTGPSTVSLAYGAGPGAGTAWVQEYTAGAGTTWSLDTTGENGSSSGAPSTISFASLTPSSSSAATATAATTTTTAATTATTATTTTTAATAATTTTTAATAATTTTTAATTTAPTTAAAATTATTTSTGTTTPTGGSSSPGELYVAGAYGLMVSYNAGSTPGYVYST